MFFSHESTAWYLPRTRMSSFYFMQSYISALRFDQEWEQKAQKNLLFPRGRASGQQYLGGPTSGLQTPSAPSTPNRYLTASNNLIEQADGAGEEERGSG